MDKAGAYIGYHVELLTHRGWVPVAGPFKTQDEADSLRESMYIDRLMRTNPAPTPEPVTDVLCTEDETWLFYLAGVLFGALLLSIGFAGAQL